MLCEASADSLRYALPSTLYFPRGMFGALHVLREEPTYATALTETDGVAYTLVRYLLHSCVIY